MPAIQLSNQLNLVSPKATPSIQPLEDALERSDEGAVIDEASRRLLSLASPTLSVGAEGDIQTVFVFELPMGFVDGSGRRHRRGTMRLARTLDEIEPMSDPRVQANPAYATVIILSRVIQALGELPAVSSDVIEQLFAGDLNYLQSFYRQVNGLA